MKAGPLLVVSLWLGCIACASVIGAVPDSGLIEAGRNLYFGKTATVQAAELYGVPIPGSGCAQCHGNRGQVRTEGGVRVPSIQWTELTRASQNGAAYPDDLQLLSALATGVGRSGQALQPPMPRFQLNDHEQRALLAFLKVLGTDTQPVPGVYPDRIVVGAVLPQDDANQKNNGQAMRAALQARFDTLNNHGGVFGRRIDLRVRLAAPGADGAARAALALVSSDEVFALVASVLPDPDAELLLAMHQHDVPSVATLGLAKSDSKDPYLNYLLPSLQQQRQQLDTQMLQVCPVTQPLSASCRGTLFAVSGMPKDTPEGSLVEVIALPVPAAFLDALIDNGKALWPTLAEAAAQTFIEALSGAGRQLDGPGLISGLQNLHQHTVAPGLTVSFGPQRHHGVDIDYIRRERNHVSSIIEH